ncbi:hypothetical protein [Wolbachia endosymbiont of Rhagoletis cingulata]|uniref:hypothetical protein n=1 Tax=Wolbachia endosymbiont of Rhagoletis cingulata TaxID=1220542 RepID=UPI003AF3F858
MSLLKLLLKELLDQILRKILKKAGVREFKSQLHEHCYLIAISINKLPSFV